MKDQKRVIIVGGGFGGIALAKGLGNSSLDVLILDKSNHHLFQPLLYQVATAALSPGDIAVPIREIVSEFKNITVFMDEVISIDRARKSISTKSGKEYGYDYLVLAVGARHSYFGNDQWESFAPGLKTLDDALNIRNRMLETFELAEKNSNGEDLNFVVVGGGPTGVEMAGALAEIAKQTLIEDFRNIDSSKAKIYLVEGQDQILGMYPKPLSLKAKKYLEDLRVEVVLNTFVENIDEETVSFGNKKIKSSNVIWAAGNQASPLLKLLKTEEDHLGRAIVDSDLSIKDSDDVFVIGDAAHFKDTNGNILPGLAPVAAQQGKYLARKILGKTSEPFHYWDKGSMATIGKAKAILKKDSIEFGGFLAWLAWCFVHILFLIDFRNKIIVFTQWALAFLFTKRGVRIIRKD